MSESATAEFALDAAVLSDAGTERERNEDHCGWVLDGPGCAVLAVADGVSGYEGAEVASRMAIEVVLRAYREQPATVKPGKRLYRAVQQANIEIYDVVVVVPELRSMATTLTAAVIDRGELTAAHVGDSRLYRVHGGEITQLTKDHTALGDASKLTRSVGRELIVSIDTLTLPVVQDDVLILCSDGLYKTLDDHELEEVVRGRDAAGACRALIDAANTRGSHDNVTAGVVRITGPTLGPERSSPGIVGKLRRLFVGGSIA